MIEPLINSDEIWTKSNFLLEKLINVEATKKIAYDVTTYMNKVDYEEMVVRVLKNGIQFERVFCLDVKSDRPSDRAMKLFLDKIITGNGINRNEIRDFEGEIAKAFNERGNMSGDELERLGSIVKNLHQALEERRLRVSCCYPQHTDFVGIVYGSSGGKRATDEVVFNFKTTFTGLTYTVGFHADGRFAYEFRRMFDGILFFPILLKGDELDKKYVLHEPIGEGMYNPVWKAYEKELGRHVAVKIFRNGLGKYRLLKHEAMMMARVEKPDSIVVVHGVGRSKKIGWIVMELLEVPTLYQYLRSMVEKGKWFELEDARGMIQDCLEAVRFAHGRDVIHGDVKPGNIFVLKKNRIKLGDFGVARIISKAQEGEKAIYPHGFSKRFGDPIYSAPEVLEGKDPSERSDLFSIGIVAYILLTGQHPFMDKTSLIPIPELIQSRKYMPRNPSEQNREIPARYDKFVLRLLQKAPNKRYKNAESALKAWRNLHLRMRP